VTGFSLNTIYLSHGGIVDMWSDMHKMPYWATYLSTAKHLA